MTIPSPRKLKLPTREPWERDLYLLWLALALTMIGFGSVFPFLPLYMRELGIEDPGRAALWGGMLGGVSGFFMVFSGPLWGVIGDRSGRKKNVVRGVFGFAAVMFGASLVPNVYWLLGLWVFLGMMPGPGMVAMPVVTAMAPKHRVQYAVGVLMSSMFLGFTIGPLIGGAVIDSLGFRTSLMSSSALLVVAGSIVVLFVKESRQPSASPEPMRLRTIVGGFASVARSRAIAPVLGILFLVQAGGSLMMPALPLFLGALSSAEDVASKVGVAFAIMSVSGGTASVLVGKIGRRIGRTPLIAGSFMAIGVMYMPMLLIGDVVSAYVVLGLVGFLGGGLVTSAFALVGSVAGENQSTAYGAAHSASSMAWGAAPLAGGAIAGMWGIREVFFVLAIAYVVAGVVAIRLLATVDGAKEEAPAEKVAPAPGPAGGD